MGLSELYLQMGRLICAFVMIVGIIGILMLAIDRMATWGQEKIDATAERKRMSYRKVAKRHGRIVR
jgi:hypothetical protein|nr:MAG TPA: hypothetical protein [Caudoviricetes sp.]